MTQSTQMDAQSCHHLCHAPIGLFDSGVGGLSVYLHLQQRLPNERYVYYADTLNVPYGSRSKDEITRLTLQAVNWLVATGCKLIVMACNSASAHALTVARQQHPDIDIVGLVPALKPAVLASQTKKVAVLATQATLQGDLLNAIIDEFARPHEVAVTKWSDPDLVPWVESGMPASSEVAHRLKSTLHELIASQVDYLVLGCTHYPFFRKLICDELARCQAHMTVIDSGAAIASRVYDLLLSQGKLAPPAKDKIKSEAPVPISACMDTTEPMTLAQEALAQEALVQATLAEDPICVSILHQSDIMNAGSIHTTTINMGEMGNDTYRSSRKPKDLASAPAMLAFFVTDPATDIAQMQRMIGRLLDPKCS